MPDKQPSPTAKILADIGLGENEAALYEALIGAKDQTIPQLTHQTPFSRTMLYHVLDNLKAAGLITQAKQGKKTVFNAEPPDKLQSLLTVREEALRRQKEVLGVAVEGLFAQYRTTHAKPGMRFFEGRSGFAEALDDSLSATDTIYTIADAEAVEKYVADINAAYVKKRRQKKIPKKILLIDSPAGRAAMAALKLQKDELTEIKLLPAGIKPFNTGIEMYNNKITFLTLRAENILSVIINDPDVAAMQRQIFEFLWSVGQTPKENLAATPTPATGLVSFSE